MKTKISRITTVFFALTAFVVSGFAQSDIVSSAAGDKYVISAKAGGVNYTEGSVSIVRKVGKSGQLLKGDRIEIGDRVSTSTDGKAEILLNPGSYLRLGGNSSFEFKTTALEDLQIKLESGSAMLEVFATNDFRVVINVPKVKYTVIESGVYRIDVLGEGNSKIAVWSGQARVGNVADGAVKGGREATVENGRLSIAKFDKDNKGQLELWSKARAKDLAKVSERLKRDNLRPSLISSFYGRGWNMYDSFGLWVYDPFYRGFCFLPFGQGWYSPYGYGYGQSIWHYNLPTVIYNQPSPRPVTSKPPTGQGPTWTGVPPSSTDRLTKRNEAPPFVKMQGGDTRGGGRADGPVFTGGGRNNSRPVYSPPPAADPVRIAPAPMTKGKNEVVFFKKKLSEN